MTPVTTYRNRFDHLFDSPGTSDSISSEKSPSMISVATENTGSSVGNVSVGCSSAQNFFTTPPQFNPSDAYLYPYLYGSPFQLPYQSQFSNGLSSTPDHPSKPFFVKLLNNRIKKCRGCNKDFCRKLDGSPPDPPLDMIIAHEERRPFSDSQNVKRLSRPQNVYYHSNLACIRANHPRFVGNELQIPAAVNLAAVHKKYLNEHFQLYC